MSSIRGLKKEIGNITYEVVSDCFGYILVNGEKNKEKAISIITETINLRNDMIYRLGHFEGEKSRSKIKAYYAKIKKDLYAGMDKSLQKLSKLSA